MIQRQDRVPAEPAMGPIREPIPAKPDGPPYVVAVTGHRDLIANDLPVIERSVRELLESIMEATGSRPLHFMSALADGADQVFAQQVVALRQRLRAAHSEQAQRVKLLVTLPMPQAAYIASQQDLATNASTRIDGLLRQSTSFDERFFTLVQEASEVFVVPARASTRDDGGNATCDLSQLSAADGYDHLAAYLASAPDLLVALWDGQLDDSPVASLRPGGTQDTVRRRLQVASEVVRPRSVNLLQTAVDGLVHVPVRRAMTNSGRQKSLKTVPV